MYSCGRGARLRLQLYVLPSVVQAFSQSLLAGWYDTDDPTCSSNSLCTYLVHYYFYTLYIVAICDEIFLVTSRTSTRKLFIIAGD